MKSGVAVLIQAQKQREKKAAKTRKKKIEKVELGKDYKSGNVKAGKKKAFENISGAKVDIREKKKQELLGKMQADQLAEKNPVDSTTINVYHDLLARQNYFFGNESGNETDDEDKKVDTDDIGAENYIHDYARPRNYIVKQNSKVKFWFDMMIISLASFNVFTIPFIIAFIPGWAESWYYITIIWLINFIFVIDIFVNLRTTYINNRTGDEVWDPKMIAKKYVFGPRFTIDFLSALPLDQFIPQGLFVRDIFSLLGMLKAVRVMRLSKVIQSLNIRQDIKAYLKLLKLVFYLIIYIHFIACIFYYIVQQQKQWIPGLDFIYGETTFFENSSTMRYLSVMYHAVMLIGLNEVYSHTTLECFAVAFLMLLSSMVNANIFGVIAVLVSEANKSMTDFQEQLDTSNTAMSNLGVPIQLQRNIKEFMLITRNHQARQKELKEFLGHCSPSLKNKVYSHIFSEATKRNDILFDIISLNTEESEKIKHYFVSKLSIQLADPEEVIIEQGMQLNEDPHENFFYIITSGECSVISKDKASFEDTNIKVMLEGDHFGEVALLYKCKRTASVMSINYCTLGRMSEIHFKDFLSKFNYNIEEKFREIIYQYDDPLTIFLLETIDKIDYFRGVSEKTKRDIVYSMNPINYDKGGMLFKPGDEADAMYIIDSGVVEIYILMDKGVEFIIDRLYKGSVINHRAFLFNDVIDTYARCASMVSLFYIKIDDLSSIRDRDPFVDNQINKIEESMVYRDNAVAIDYVI
jgi:CRP-like cAMP-binding protein